VSLLTDRLDLDWSRRWTYYRSVQSLLVNDQSHKIQLRALSRLILRLVNQEMGGFCPLVSSHWSSRSWIPNTKRIHKPRDTIAHKVKPEALSQLDIEACVSERTYYRTVHSTILRMNLLQDNSILWTRRQIYRWISLILLARLVMNYLFMTQGQWTVDRVSTIVLLDLLNCEFWAIGRFIDSGLSCT
jgi:hypothetical protein